MAQRRVTQTREDNEGDITALCNPNADWSPRPKTAIIRDIVDEVYSYFVQIGENRTNGL